MCSLADWEPFRLGDLVDVIHGFAFGGDCFRDEPPGDILLTPGNFQKGGGFKAASPKYYVGPVPQDYVLAEGDLLVTMTDLSKSADTLGYPALVPEAPLGARFLHNQRLGKVLVKEPSRLDIRFLYYVLCSREYRHEVLAGATGTTVRHTSPTRIAAFEFGLPPLPEQRAIAHVLGSLDDKIELNRRMNETLEAMARAIFKSWFVDCDPVRAKMDGRRPACMDAATAALFPDAFEDSELGEIPKGWSVGTIGDVAHQTRRGVRPEDMGPETPYIGLEHMPRRSISLSEWGAAADVSSAKSGFRRGEILFGKLRPYFHKVGVALLNGVGSTDIVVVLPREEPWFGFTLGHLSSDQFVAHADATSTGTKMPRTNWEAMARYPVALPPVAIAEAYSRLVLPFIDLIHSHVFESRSLAAIRDALLPRLLSGEIRVPDDVRPPESAS